MEQDAFSRRLSELRINKGVSARDISLSIGQSPSYINNIENGINYPSKERELLNTVKGLNNEQLDNLISLAKGLKR